MEVYDRGVERVAVPGRFRVFRDEQGRIVFERFGEPKSVQLAC